MEEKNIVRFKKEEFAIREYVKNDLGKGKVSKVIIEYTPVGEKIVITTHKPGLVIGRKGEKINELTRALRSKFKLENPHIEIEEISKPEFDARIMADEIAIGLERMGPMKFKVLAYRALQRIMGAGAAGAEIRLGGKLPSARARAWRFAQGFLKKTGDEAKVVDRAQAKAETKPGTVGIKVGILSPNVKMKDRIIIDEILLKKLRENAFELEKVIEKPKRKLVKSRSKK